jgi:hypothetical protein
MRTLFVLVAGLALTTAKIKSKYFTSPDALKSAIDELLGMN